MTRKEAEDGFDCLRRHAQALRPPDGAPAALKLVDGASLAQLQRDAIIHYVSVGPAVVSLAYRVLKAGTATFVAARFAAGEEIDEPAQRDLFARRMLALAGTLEGTTPAARATGLIDALTERLAGGRRVLEAAPGAEPSDGVGDLLEAAGIAYALAQLLENPPVAAVARGSDR